MTYSRASPSELGGGALCPPAAEPPPIVHGGLPKGTKGGQSPWLKRKRLKTQACFSLLAVQPTEPKARSDQGSACPVPGPVPQAFFSSRKAKRLASPYRDRDSGLRGHTGLNQGVYRTLSCHQRRQGWTEHRCESSMKIFIILWKFKKTWMLLDNGIYLDMLKFRSLSLLNMTFFFLIWF